MAAFALYQATLWWKVGLLFKLTFGIWDQELIELMQVKYRSFQFDLNPDDDDMKHEDMIKAVGESYTLAWQILPYMTFLAKAGEAMNEAPIFVVDKVTNDAMALEDEFQGPWIHGGEKRILAVNTPKSAELEEAEGKSDASSTDLGGAIEELEERQSDEIVPTFDGAVAAAEQSRWTYGRGGGRKKAPRRRARKAPSRTAPSPRQSRVPSATEIDAVLASGIAALEAQAKELTDTVRRFMVDLTLPLGVASRTFSKMV